MKVYVVASIGCLECGSSSSIDLVTTDRALAERTYIDLNNQDSRFKRDETLSRPTNGGGADDWNEDGTLLWGQVSSDHAHIVWEKELSPGA